MSSEHSKIQKRLRALLIGIFGSDRVKKEWPIWSDAPDRPNQKVYGPKLDLAVGPFNREEGDRNNVTKIQCESQRPLILKIQEKCERQNGRRSFCGPINPRCLLAVEISCSGSLKYALGEFTNASMMGFVGVVIVSGERFQELQRVQEYFKFLRNKKKADEKMFANVALYREDEFVSLLRGRSNATGGARLPREELRVTRV